jgi:3-methyl-2-oxobutanoate hydroxymethyltransferase
MMGRSVKKILEVKGKRQLAYVQVSCEEKAFAAAQASMDIIETAFI